jgi:geranylgeranyl diphosphate synthase type II
MPELHKAEVKKSTTHARHPREGTAMAAMELATRIEDALQDAIAGYESAAGGPPRLAQSLRYAVFPSGARIRPRLCLTVALANGDDDPAASNAAAAALEFVHCASLVHDDLPCFDDATVRRNKLSLHLAFGQREAVLTGDALIAMAFDVIARGAARHPQRTIALLRCVADALTPPNGIIAGQAWECEPMAELSAYQRAKTGAMFVAASMAGAIAAGADPQQWRTLGERLGEAYQIADDIRDVVAHEEEIGKPVGRDAALGRPNAVVALGMARAVTIFEKLVGQALDSIPPCAGRQRLQQLIRAEALRLVPEEYLERAA